MAEFWVNGIVAQRDGKPYLQLANEKGMIAQMSMKEARQIAMDMLVMASRAEMDAMIVDWMREELGASSQARGAALVHFREYRGKLDDEKIEHSYGEVDRPDKPDQR